MSKKTVTFGFLFLAGSIFHFLANMVGHLMEKEMPYASIEKIWGVEWIDQLPFSSSHSYIVSVAAAPLYAIFLAIGILLLLISTLQKH